MTDREINSLAWGAFLLGARVKAGKEGKRMGPKEIGEIARMAREIADSEITLEEPAELVAKFPDQAAVFHRLEAMIIRSNRELAQRVCDGYRTATEERE